MRNADENKETKGHNNHLMARLLPGLSETSGSLQLLFIIPYNELPFLNLNY
jgi:hypothetical protein